jgi:hypothetical protein
MNVGSIFSTAGSTQSRDEPNQNLPVQGWVLFYPGRSAFAADFSNDQAGKIYSVH